MNMLNGLNGRSSITITLPDDMIGINFDYQRQIVDTFVNRIYVYDDKLVLTYNYKDGTESITLEDIQKAFGSDLSSIAPPSKTEAPKRVLLLLRRGWDIVM